MTTCGSEPPRQDGLPLFRYYGVVGAAGGEFVHGRNDIPELVWRRPDGSVRQIMRWQPEWAYTTEESRERFLACWESQLRADPNRTEAIIEMDLARHRFNYDEPEPLFTTIFGDDEGRAWLWHWEVPCYNELRFTVIGPDGIWLGVFDSEVIVLSSDGSAHEVLARSGEGPGEVDYVTDMFVLGRDSLLVLDQNRSRFLLFVNGSLAHSASIADLQGTTSLSPRGIDAAGRFLVSTSSFRSGFEEEWLFGHVARYDPETGAVDTVASYEMGVESVVVYELVGAS